MLYLWIYASIILGKEAKIFRQQNEPATHFAHYVRALIEFVVYTMLY